MCIWELHLITSITELLLTIRGEGCVIAAPVTTEGRLAGDLSVLGQESATTQKYTGTRKKVMCIDYHRES